MFKLSNGDIPNFNSSTNGGTAFDAELVLRKKRGDNFQGQIVDILRHGVTSGTAVSEADGRIVFQHTPVASPPANLSSGNNIILNWNTAQATLLPNESVTVFGDLKITNSSNPPEVVHHIRLAFDILPEITA